MSLWDWLFGGKKNDDFGAPARMAPSTPHAPSRPVAPPAAAAPPPLPPGMQQLQLSAPAAVPTSYGIQRAIELMRALPIDDDPALVLRVVRKTLRSTGVSLEEIVTTAGEREAALIRGIESDRAAIEQLEIQITTRKANITRLEGDLEETRDVRARIEEALASETKIGNVLPPEEIIRIRAEAAQKAASKAPPVPTPPKVGPPAVPSRPPPKLPSALSAPVATPKPEAPKPEPAKTEAKAAPAKTEPAKVEPAKTESAKAEPAKIESVKVETKPEPSADPKSEPGARSGPMSSIPDLGEIDDGFDETTATREIPIPSEAVGKDTD